jgi:hypothetical protein
MLTRTWSSSFAVKGALTRAVQFARRDTNGLPLVRLDHDALERLKIGLLAEHLHPADRSVQDVINDTPRVLLSLFLA